MLGQRIVTAVVLLALLVPAALSTEPWPFPALTVLLLAAAGWEWARLHGGDGRTAWGLAVLLLVACVAGWDAAIGKRVPREIWICAAFAWVLGGAWALRHGVEGWRRHPRWVTWPVGFLALWGAWMALVTARAQGLGFVLSVLCLVWVADIAAYFGGRAFGRHKLAPSISPGKSWEGVWAGMLGVLALAWGWVSVGASGEVWGASLFTALVARYEFWGTTSLVLLLAAMSVVGDLFESLVKRAAGVKDSSHLLPGHGGVLDRIDALLPVFPLALALSSL